MATRLPPCESREYNCSTSKRSTKTNFWRSAFWRSRGQPSSAPSAHASTPQNTCAVQQIMHRAGRKTAWECRRMSGIVRKTIVVYGIFECQIRQSTLKRASVVLSRSMSTGNQFRLCWSNYILHYIFFFVPSNESETFRCRTPV